MNFISFKGRGNSMLFLFLLIVSLSSCSGSDGVKGKDNDAIVLSNSDSIRDERASKQASRNTLDSLIAYCYRYTAVQPPSELRRVALQVIDSVPWGSSRYFYAQVYLIHSYYIEGDWEKVSRMLDEVEAVPELKQFPYEQLKFKYVRINLYRALEDFDSALRVSAEILNIRPVNEEQAIGLKNGFNGVIMQMVTSYLSSYRRMEGFWFFRELQKTDNPVLTRYCRRDLAVATAYMAFKAGMADTARMRMEEALQLPFYGDSTSNLARDYCYAGEVFSHFAGETEKAIGYWQKAIELVNKYDPQEIMPWAQASLGDIYSREGRFRDAVKLQYGALRVYEQWKDDAGKAYTYSLLADMHTFWGYYDKAEKYVDKAIHCAVNARDDDSRGKAVLAHYRLLKARGETDTLISVLFQAEEAFRIAGNSLGVREAQALRGLEYTERRNTCRQGTNILQQVLEDPLSAGLECLAEFRSGLGMGLIRQGRAAEGLQLLLESVRSMEQEELNMPLLSRYAFLVEYFSGISDNRNLIKFVYKYNELKDRIFNEQKIKAVAKARIEYETDKEVQAKRLLETELKLQERTNQYYLVFGLAFIFLLSGGLSWLGMRHRALRLQHTIHQMKIAVREEQVKSLLQTQKVLNRKNEELRVKIEQVLTQQRQKGEILPELETVVSKLLAPRFLTEEEETVFRRTYQEYYPEFLPGLRKKCPAITRNEELLCMLVNIGFSTDDVALALGISRESVNTSRYRIRKKLGLGKDEKLNEWITKG